MFIYPSMFLLESAISSSMTDMPFGERMVLGLRVTLLGMGTCFSVLALLWGILSLFKVIFAREKKAVVPAAENKALPVTTGEELKASDNSDELVAVITAAAYAYLEAEAAEKAAAEGKEVPQTKFRVVSFSKTGTKKIKNRQR